MENRAQNKDRAELKKNVRIEVARCVWWLELRLYVEAEDQMICHIVWNSQKIINIK